LILIVDDDKDIADLISDSLIDEDFKTQAVYDPLQALSIISAHKDDIDMIILDIMMPNMDGLELCRRVRDGFEGPILFVTAKKRTIDTVVGFEMGGDDYIAKPFVVDELVSRVKAHLRREQRSRSAASKICRFGDITVYKDSFEVEKAGEKLELSTREFQLLCYLCENMGRVLTREQIFDAVWGTEYNDINAVTFHIKNLRDKIDKENKHIKTIWGVGYKMVGNGDRE